MFDKINLLLTITTYYGPFLHIFTLPFLEYLIRARMMMEQKSVKYMINNVTLYGYTQLNMGASFKLSIRVHFPRCLPVGAFAIHL